MLAHRFIFFVISHFFHTFRNKRVDLVIGNMSNDEETGPSDQDADEMDYEDEQEYLDYLTAKQGLQVGLDDGTDADIDTDGADIDGSAETGGEGTSPDAATENRKHKKQRIRKPTAETAGGTIRGSQETARPYVVD